MPIWRNCDISSHPFLPSGFELPISRLIAAVYQSKGSLAISWRGLLVTDYILFQLSTAPLCSFKYLLQLSVNKGFSSSQFGKSAKSEIGLLPLTGY
ncbi:hypothetical protein CEXT_567341 [Caerostris extrusa]|uniref:Uncharacterized protein n=1 Tax=Caerostris extrusa TaxID=172846 RepID=A0AAV4V6G6_CAEEX|nr:hypothetical protein CEXT_567341 [Caerostris extrusa]